MARRGIEVTGRIIGLSFVVVGAPRGLMGNMPLLYVGMSMLNDLKRLYRLGNLL